jgi:sugar-specific transcriptional regulator TrmB
LACLELGETSIVPIVKKVAYPRTTVFHLLEKLEKKRLIEIIQTAHRRFYAAYPPRKILTLYKNKKTRIEGEIDSFKTILPELSRLYSLYPFQPKIRFYKGKEIRDIYEEILKTPVNEIYYTGNINQLDEILGKRYLKNWIKRRIEKGILTKSIRIRGTESKIPLYQPTKEYLRAARYAPDTYKCPAHIYIYGDNVAILTSVKENFGIVITSRDFAMTMKAWFKELWKISKKK